MNEIKEPKPHGKRYPWLEWFSKGEIKLYKGEHYDVLDHGFAQCTRRAAKRYGYLISIEINEGYIVITVNGRTNECPEVHTNKYRRGKDGS